MAMNMRRAFNSRMFSSMVVHKQEVGQYNDDNDWVAGVNTSKPIRGVIQAGNKFSQFEEGMAIHTEDGGTRISDFRSLYVTSDLKVELENKITYKGVHYNVLQQSDEDTYGFDSFLLEKSKDWSPPV